MADTDPPRASDDLETAERKSLSVDERAHERQRAPVSDDLGEPHEPTSTT